MRTRTLLFPLGYLVVIAWTVLLGGATAFGQDKAAPPSANPPPSAAPRPTADPPTSTGTGSAAAPSGASSLGVRQQRVQRLTEEMDGKFKSLAQALESTEPEKAERLIAALQQARTMHLAPRMRQVADLLDTAKLDAASGEQKQLLADLERLLQLLLAESRAKENERDEREQLAAWRQEIQRLLEQQRALRGDTQSLQNKDSPPPADRPAALKKLAAQQANTATQTGQLAQQMKQAAGDKPNANPKPGAAKVAQAESAMKSASECLGSGECDSADEQQSEAQQKLEQALKELDERLQQLDNETDRGPQIEAMLREILAKQQRATLATAEVESRRAADGMLRRADRLALGKLTADEKSLADALEQLHQSIAEEGLSVVFLELLGQTGADVATVAGRLDKQLTDIPTRELQREIESSLEELIDALQKENKRKQQQSSGGEGSGGGKPPLLPNSAELKLLKSRQLKVNRRTETLANAPAGELLPSDRRSELDELSRQQATIEELTGRLIERLRENMP